MAVALREGRAIRNAEAVAERPDGTRIPFIPFPTPLRDTSGKVVGAINMLVYISEQHIDRANNLARGVPDRKSTRLNSSHPSISYAVFCLKKKKKTL